MPKEVIQYPRTEGFSGTEMSVHWSKEASHVQIGLTRHVWGELDPAVVVSPTHGDHHHCNECAVVVERNKVLRADGRPEMMECDSAASPAPPVGEFEGPSTVFTQPMTRFEMNQLIRVLRRARDQAFGEDA